MKLSRRKFLIAGIFVVVAGEVHARRRMRFGRGLRSRGGKKSYGSETLNPEQLRECLSKKDELSNKVSKLKSLQNELSDISKTVEQNSKSLVRKELLVDRYSQASVDDYNLSVKQHREMVNFYNSKFSDYEPFQNVYQQEQAEFNESCANKKYYESDLPKP